MRILLALNRLAETNEGDGRCWKGSNRHSCVCESVTIAFVFGASMIHSRFWRSATAVTLIGDCYLLQRFAQGNHLFN